MKLSRSFLVVGSAITLSVAADPVCIVGAGPAGLTIANRLESKGYHTIIFERRDTVGGKCKAYHEGQVRDTYTYR